MPEINFKLIIWIVILIVYVVRQFKKKLSVPSTQAPDVPVLEKKVPKKETVVYKPQIEPKSIDKKLISSKKLLTKPLQSESKSQKSIESESLEGEDYDEHITTAATLSQQQKIYLKHHQKESIVSKEDKSGRFEVFSETQVAESSVSLERLRSLSNLKEAIVMGEILQTKF